MEIAHWGLGAAGILFVDHHLCQGFGVALKEAVSASHWERVRRVR